MTKSRPAHTDAPSAGVAVFTSMDGTLLDPVTFDAGPNRDTIARLAAAGVAVVPVSVMTIDEIAPIAADLCLRDPMVIEAGGAIARWNAGRWDVEPCGPPAEVLLDVIRDIEDRSGAHLLVYSVLPPRDAALVSGRRGPMLEASTRRHFSEPFLVESGDLDEIDRAAHEIGFSVRRGRRFFYLCRDCNEGDALDRLRAELRCDVAIAAGGSLLDAEFLVRADVPIIVPDHDGRVSPELIARVPNARIAPAPAPGGWTAAVADASRTAIDALAARK